jgi:putative glutamine amidotransferase
MNSNSRKPIIAIDCDHIIGPKGIGRFNMEESYVRAVELAGGVPLLMPPSPEIELAPFLERVDGVIISGGDDYSGEQFGLPPHPLAEPLTARREAFGLRLARFLIEETKPFLAICLGSQTLNIVLGGTLHLDLPEAFPESTIQHRAVLGNSRNNAMHDVEILPGSFFSSLWGSGTIRVNSRHHQAVDELAPSCRLGARAPDGVIEAFELTAHPCGLAVQWHPEAMPDDENQVALLRAFVERANAHA